VGLSILLPLFKLRIYGGTLNVMVANFLEEDRLSKEEMAMNYQIIMLKLHG
jgi:hypothetical protein